MVDKVMSTNAIYLVNTVLKTLYKENVSPSGGKCVLWIVCYIMPYFSEN